MTVSDWGPDSPEQEGAVPASTVAQGATNPPNPDPSAIPSGNDDSGDLSPETVAELVALARVIDPDACDPPETARPVGEANEVWRRQDAALLTAKAVWDAAYRLASDDEATVDRVAAALANADGRRWTNADGSLTPPLSAGLMWPVASGEYYRARARAAVRALREGQ